MKMPAKPIRLLTCRQLRRDHGLSWHRIQRRIDRGELVPFAFHVGPCGNETGLFHPDQVEELVATCKNRPRRPLWGKAAGES